MIIFFVLAFIIIWLISPLFRLICKNILIIPVYAFTDFLSAFKNKKWRYNNFPFGITLYIGMFGCGKTLTMTHRARLIYNSFGGKVRILSNYHLNDIPYIPLINFNQLCELEEDQDQFIGTLVLIDEIEHLLSHRNFAKFPLQLVSVLCQQRKCKVAILASAQRYAMVDKLFRSITTYVVDCKKVWRFSRCITYDAWEMENAVNYESIKPINKLWWFVKNQDYNAYDTMALIRKETADDFISNDEAIKNKGLDMIRQNINVKNVITTGKRKGRS